MGNMEHKRSETLDNLLAIFEIRDKGELAAHVKHAAITKSDLANLILACQCETITLCHFPIFRHHHPTHLALTDENLKALASNGVGKFSPSAQKTVNKISQMFEQRRLLNAHMFWPPHLLGHWHLFYFDQRDTSDTDNHWDDGEHIHLMNMLTHPQLDPNELLRTISAEERPKLGGGFHIRWIDESRKRSRAR